MGTDGVPQVVLLDVMMGDGISGLECCREIRQYRGMGEHELPVILVTASDSDSLLQQGFEVGATDYIQKPFSLSVLLARLENALRLRELFTATAGSAGPRTHPCHYHSSSLDAPHPLFCFYFNPPLTTNETTDC